MDMRAVFVRDIRDNPGCAVTRLIFADYLQDNGQPEHAEYIRRVVAAENKVLAHNSFRDYLWCDCMQCQKISDSQSRMAYNWYGIHHEVKWVGGCIVEIACEYRDWLENGPTWVREHPIQHVNITNHAWFIIDGYGVKSRLRVDIPVEFSPGLTRVPDPDWSIFRVLEEAVTIQSNSAKQPQDAVAFLVKALLAWAEMEAEKDD